MNYFIHIDGMFIYIYLATTTLVTYTDWGMSNVEEIKTHHQKTTTTSKQ